MVTAEQGELFILGSIIFISASIILAFRPKLIRRESRVQPTSTESHDAPVRFLTPEDKTFMTRVFFIALLIRISAAVLFVYIDDGRFLDGDGKFAEKVGVYFSDDWKGIGPGWWWDPKQGIVLRGKGEELGFYWLNGVLIYIFGKTVILPKLINSFAGAVVVLLIYRIAGFCFNRRVAERSAWLVTFMPSMIMWSSLNVKDMYVILLISTTLYYALKLRDEMTPASLIGVIISIAIMRLFRKYMPQLIALPIIVGFIALRGKTLGRNYTLGILLLVTIAAGSHIFGYQVISSDLLNFERVNSIRSNMSIESQAAAYHSGVDISSPIRAILFFPVGLVYFLFAPFPWAINPTRLRQLLSLPEILIWYALIPSVIRGIRYGLKNIYHKSGFIILTLVPTTVAYSLCEGNVGTAFRHRAQVLIFLLIFAAVGLEVKNKRERITGASKENT